MPKLSPSFCFQSPVGYKGHWQLPSLRVELRSEGEGQVLPGCLWVHSLTPGLSFNTETIWYLDKQCRNKPASKQTNPTAEPTKLSSSESCWVAILFHINLISMQLLGDNLSNQWCTLAKPNLCIWVSHRWPNFIFFWYWLIQFPNLTHLGSLV